MEQEPTREKAPYDDLCIIAEKKLLELFPALKDKKASLEKRRLFDAFVMDVLDNGGVEGSTVFHRLNAERQKKLLKETGIESPESLFENIPEDICAFYQDKINKLK